MPTSSDTLFLAEKAFADGRYAAAHMIAAQALEAVEPDDHSVRKGAERIMRLVDDTCVSGALPANDIPENYHKWYYDNMVWRTTSWGGIPLMKSVSDLWNYQEIIVERRPSLIVEFGTYTGGSALFFAHVTQLVGLASTKIISVDITHAALHAKVRGLRSIEFIESSSTAPAIAPLIAQRRAISAGPAFVILDSNHSEEHVYTELCTLRPILIRGDYVIVEDTNVNGHPVLPEFGPGPHEGLARYEREFPTDYFHDRIRERKFGFTFATDGFLIRR